MASSLKGKITVTGINTLSRQIENDLFNFRNLAVTEVLHNGELIKCTATVISPITILLPAYCVFDIENEEYYVGLAAQIATVFYTPLKSIAHTKYKEARHDYEFYDIAVSIVSRLENINSLIAKEPEGRVSNRNIIIVLIT